LEADHRWLDCHGAIPMNETVFKLSGGHEVPVKHYCAYERDRQRTVNQSR
jgi:hypothetical protein